MRPPVVVSYARTPFARSFVGGLKDVSEFELAKTVINAVIDRSGVRPDTIDNIVLGEVLQGGGCIARYAALDLGLPRDIPGVAVNGWCASGMMAIHHAVATIRSGMQSCVIAGGIGAPSRSPLAGPSFLETGVTEFPVTPMHPGMGAIPALDLALTMGDGTAKEYGLTRDEVDEWAARAHALAIAAIDAGVMDSEKVAVEADGARVTADEFPMRENTLESLRKLDSFMGGDCTVTVGNQTGLTDGAAAMLICAPDFADQHGLTPLAEVIGWATVGSEPDKATGATIDATRRALDGVGIDVDGVDLFELHDSYGSIGVAYERVLQIPRDKLNVHGGGLALGHPYGASGARVAGTLIHELRRRGGGIGAGSIVSAGGLGSAVVLNVLGGAD